MNTQQQTKELKGKKTEGRMRVLRATLYKSHMVYVRMVGTDYFEYLLEYNGEIYSSYIIITPKKGSKKLTEDEINQAAALAYAGAEATLDQLLGHDEVSEDMKKYIETIERSHQVKEKDKDA